MVVNNDFIEDTEEEVEFDELTEMEMSFAYDDGYEDGFKDIYRNHYEGQPLLEESYNNGYAAGIGDFYEKYK